MKKICVCMIILMGMSVLKAEAFDWGSVLNFFTRASETQTEMQTITAISDLETKMTEIDNTAKTAFVDIVSSLSGWLETRSVKSDLKSKTLSEVINEYTSTYLAENKDKITKSVKKMSSKEKTELLNNLTKLTESGQNYLLLAANGVKAATNTIKTAQNASEIATTMSNINKIASDLKTRATSVVTFTNQIQSIAKTAGLKG